MFIDLRLYFPRVSDRSSGTYILQQFQLNSSVISFGLFAIFFSPDYSKCYDLRSSNDMLVK